MHTGFVAGELEFDRWGSLAILGFWLHWSPKKAPSPNFGLSEGTIYNLGWRGRFMYDSEQIQMIKKLYMEVRSDHI